MGGIRVPHDGTWLIFPSRTAMKPLVSLSEDQGERGVGRAIDSGTSAVSEDESGDGGAG
jgi:hypothetical protein